MRRASQSAGVTLFQALLATFAALLCRYSAEDVFSIGIVTAGRNRPETQALLGYFLNTVVLRADLTGDPSFLELMTRMRNLTLEALQHDCVPFGQLIKELCATRVLSIRETDAFTIFLRSSVSILLMQWQSCRESSV